MAVTSDGKTLYALNPSYGSVEVIDTETGIAGPPLQLPSGSYYDFAVSPHGDRVYAIDSNSESVVFIDTKTSATTSTFAGRNPIGLVVSPDGKTLYVGSITGNSVSAVDTQTGQITQTITTGYRPFTLELSGDGQRLYVANLYGQLDDPLDATISVIDTKSGNYVVSDIPVPLLVPYVDGLALSPDGTSLYLVNVAGTPNGALTVIDTGYRPVTVEGLFAEMHPDQTDTIRAQLLVATDGTKRLVVYMSGIDDGSGFDGVSGNTGLPNPLVFSYIDQAVQDWDPEEIMLVGFSGGGQQMQIYAATGFYKERVKVLVLLGAGPTMTIFQIPQTVSLLISDRGDKVWNAATAGHLEALASYGATGSDQWSWYETGDLTVSNTRGVQTYIDAATDFDTHARTSGASAGDKLIYQSIQRFDPRDKIEDRPAVMVSPQKIVSSELQKAFQAAKNWVQDRLADAQNWLQDRATDLQNGIKAAQNWVADRATDVQNGVKSLFQDMRDTVILWKWGR